MEKDGITNFNLDYFIRLVKIAQALDKERDQRLKIEACPRSNEKNTKVATWKRNFVFSKEKGG